MPLKREKYIPSKTRDKEDYFLKMISGGIHSIPRKFGALLKTIKVLLLYPTLLLIQQSRYSI